MAMRGWRAALVIAVAGVALGYDLGSPPERQWTARGLVAAIEVYQATLSPLLGASGVKCRFEPSCSHYAVAVLERYGAVGGTWRAAWRVLRCNPWTAPGTVDPP
jgi:uncharacterized protein